MTTITPATFHVLAKPTGAICNLDCKYCFFLSKQELYPDSLFRMPDKVLESYLRQQLDSQGPEATIAWQGGGNAKCASRVTANVRRTASS